MSNPITSIRIAVSVALLDAGETTRALELARGLQAYAPQGYRADITFLSNGSPFERKVADSGFAVESIAPRLEGVGFSHDLKPDACNFVGDPALARALLEGEREALRAFRPDLVLFGFWPFANLARQMIDPPIPGVCFLPLPLEPGLYASGLMTDVPDQLKPLTYLPPALRRGLMRRLPPSLKLKAPILRQQKLLDAAQACGWEGPPLSSLFDLLRADLTLVNDLPLFYEGLQVPPGFSITGPLYAQPDHGEGIDPEILRIFGAQSRHKTKIYCTLGSSGTKAALLEAVRAIASLPADQFAAVILVPRAVCPLEAVQPILAGKPNLYWTDRFVPARLVNGLADLVVSHGGQGTVQTALASGTPIVGFAVQPEQQINLDHAVLHGAAIRIPSPRWKELAIRQAIEKVAANDAYRHSAKALAARIARSDGQRESARALWGFWLALQKARTSGR